MRKSAEEVILERVRASNKALYGHEDPRRASIQALESLAELPAYRRHALGTRLLREIHKRYTGADLAQALEAIRPYLY
jgi:hypothetical protein